MTSETVTNDLQAARAHVEVALLRLSGTNLKDAKAILASLARLIAKLA